MMPFWKISPLLQAKSVAGHPRLKFRPDPRLVPVIDAVARIALEVHPLHLRRARADQREAPLVMGVDQFIGRRLRPARMPNQPNG